MEVIGRIRQAESRGSARSRNVLACWYASPNDTGQSGSSAHVDPHGTNAKSMKKARGAKTVRKKREGTAGEYRFDYGESRSNRFAKHLAKQAVVVVLDPDVAEVFRDPRRVNALLRATIAAVENPRSRRAS